MALIILLCTVISASTAWAAPMLPSESLSSRSMNQIDLERSWVVSSAGRGTLDIVYTCSTTLFLCAYTAFHPNTPPRENCSSLVRLELMVFTLVLSECTLYLTLRQLWTANSLRKRVNSTYQAVIKRPPPGPQVMVSLSFIEPEIWFSSVQ